MSDTADPNPNKVTIDKSIANIVYALYLLVFIVGGLSVVVGVVIAYLARRRVSVPLLVSHYTWQIHIFWWSFLAIVITGVVVGLLIYSTESLLIGVLIGVISLLVITITVVVLSIRGMLDLSSDDWPSKRHTG